MTAPAPRPTPWDRARNLAGPAAERIAGQIADGIAVRITDKIAGAGDRVVDRAIAVAARRAGASCGVLFTERQLYYEVQRVLHPAHVAPRRMPLTPAPVLRYGRFAEAVRRPGDVPGLLPAPPRRVPRPPGGSTAPPDLYDYGLPRLLICQSGAVAGMLRANDVHLEAACPVVDAGDLPLAPGLLAGLGRVEGATVHVLHDASIPGLALVGRVRDQLRDLPGLRVISLGLVPRQAAALHLTAGRVPRIPHDTTGGADGRRAPLPLPAGLPAGLEPSELRWLALGRFAEVEAVAPAHLLRTVLRLLRGPRQSSPTGWARLRDLRSAGFMTWPTA